jgi:hypothetical protein
MTVLQLITSALRLIGQLGPGRSAGLSELAAALLVLNSMLEAWSAERLQVFVVQRSVHALVASQAAYTIGIDTAVTPTVDFNVARPVRIERAGILDSSIEVPIEILSTSRWADVRMKSLTSTRPTAIYYEPTMPWGTINAYPVPSATPELVLYSWAQLGQFSASAVNPATDPAINLELPPGYGDAIRFNLAVRLGLEWGRPARAEVHQLASLALGVIRSLNCVTPEMISDPAVLGCGRFDIYTGESR